MVTVQLLTKFNYLYNYKMLALKDFLYEHCEEPLVVALRAKDPLAMGSHFWRVGHSSKPETGSIRSRGFGFITYDYKNEIEDLTSRNNEKIKFPALCFFSPESKKIIAESGFRDVPDSNLKRDPDIRLNARVPKSTYIEQVKKLKSKILSGEIYEVNYCMEFYAEDVQLDPVAVFISLLGNSDAPFSCFFKYRDSYLLGASPECFLKKQGNRLISRPIKGTARRGESTHEDNKIIEDLRNDKKERSENIMITDLVRNDLSKVAKTGSVKVEELCGVYSFRQVHQMISTISCELRDSVTFEDIIRATFPMGSMTGAPKIRAMELIDQHESSRRELYSGCVGYIEENGDFEFSVVIRSICYNATEKYMSFLVGSAITAASEPEKEYEECLLKAKAMMEVIGVDFRKFA